MFISIHAPTNGATMKYNQTKSDCYISIHAPTNGATLYKTPIQKRCYISIHAPTNGATFWTQRNEAQMDNFNPRSDERSDCNFAQKNEKNYTKPLNNIIVFY